MKNKQIALLGCGWLGLPLAKALIAKGSIVKGSTTTPHKLDLLKEQGIKPYLINLDSYNTQASTDFLAESDILIINIPPKLRSGAGENYTAKIQRLLPDIEKSGITKVLFVSSTSVYADDNSTVTEDTVACPETESGKQILATEQLLQANPNFNTTILRFGGLIGADRHPVKFLAGKENLANPDAPVNLIEQEDCIEIIGSIIQQNSWRETFNAAHPHHLSRKEYYTKKAADLGLDLPKFNPNECSKGKTIAADKIIKVLGYRFKATI